MTPEQLNKEEKLSTIIELCNDINIDAETFVYIIRAIEMEKQVLKQLIMENELNIILS